LRIEVLGDGNLVKHVMCTNNVLHRMLYVEVRAIRDAEVTAMDTVLRPGNADNYFRNESYRPIRVTHLDRVGDERSAEIRFFPEGHDTCIIDDDHFLAYFKGGTLHKFAVVPKESSDSQLVESWPNSREWY
jgi:hypothetical protein